MKGQSDDQERPELIFGLVGPAGVRLQDLSTALRDHLKTFGYEACEIRLSDLLSRYAGWTKEADTFEHTRIKHRQAMGYAFRNALGDGAALARAAIVRIRETRASITGSPDRPASGRAYILEQLKHPAEVDLLRQVYGTAFVLLAGHAPKSARVKELSDRIAKKADQPGQGHRFRGPAEEIINDDDKQDDDLGQNTRDTYPQADFFANLALTSGEGSVRRFVDLLFGHPFRTPSPEEFAMYQASAVSLRSSDSSRQVGAVIVSISRDAMKRLTNADVLAFGMNEVPRGGGGFYWDEASPDARDQSLITYKKEDRATEIKISALVELIDKIRDKKWLGTAVSGQNSGELARSLLPSLKRTQFMDIGEFMRPVHAEMSALIDSARRGVKVNGHTMYVTTFPCHNCAKHVIAAGIRRVVYLEPYPKSRADFLHGEEISLESVDGTEEDGKVVFSAFSGISPRQYVTLFAMSERGTKKGRTLQTWEADRSLLVPLSLMRNGAVAHLLSERQELESLPTDAFHWDKATVCPTGN